MLIRFVCAAGLTVALVAAQDKVQRKDIVIAGPMGDHGAHVMVHGVPAAAGQTIQFIGAEMGDASGVKGAPYAAEIVTENMQTLSDGTRISNRTESAVYRDSEGRSRREVSLGKPEDGRKMVTILDPVAGVHYMIDSAENKVRKITLPKGEGTFTFSRRPDGGNGPQITEDIKIVTRTGEKAVKASAMASVVAGIHAPGQAMRLPAEAQGNVKTEDLGTRMIAGVQARGTRTTTTIPAGKIGNDRDLVSTWESWYSDELKTVVYSKRTDPRQGESTTTYSNLRRSEQPRSLFEPPAGASVDEMGPQIQIKRREAAKEL